MPEGLARDLGWHVAGPVLEALAGPGTGLAGLDATGEVVWSAGAEPDLDLAALRRRAVEEESEGVVPLGDRGALCVERIALPSDEIVAWLVAHTVDTEADTTSGAGWKRVLEAMPRVGSMLTREAELLGELAGAVDELGSRYEELNLVFSMEEEARATLDQANPLRSMLEHFVSNLRIDVGLLLHTGQALQIGARGTKREVSNLDLVVTELRGKIARYITAGKTPIVVNDRDDPRRAYLLTHMPFKLLAIPNDTCRGEAGGLLLLRHVDAPDFTNSDLSLARVFHGQASILLRNQALITKMSRFTRSIADSLVETVEAKDPYTRGHSERVEAITTRLGREVGLQASEIQDLGWGALFHDIGKIGIPDAILMKPGRLTPDEYVFIKTHPERSYEILKHIEELGQAALDGARYHQESFDGSGYPFGLAGEEIPLAARIVSVADVYDAVTSSRSYRPASSHEKGVEVVREIAGTQLDPKLVTTFLDLLEKDAAWVAKIRPSNAGALDG